MLGLGTGVVVGLIVMAWRGSVLPAVVIGLSILLAICAASMYGLGIPALLRSLKLDPKISAGPITLALTDISLWRCISGPRGCCCKAELKLDGFVERPALGTARTVHVRVVGVDEAAFSHRKSGPRWGRPEAPVPLLLVKGQARQWSPV